MYVFPEEFRKAYERLAVPMIIMGIDDNDETMPILISDGFLAFHNITREMVDSHFEGNLNGSLFEKVHPDEAAKLRVISDDFVKKHIDYDVTFRARRDDGYHLLHAIGYWQDMPDGSKVALIVYSDMNKHENVISELSQKYSLFEKDGFYTDILTDLPNINYLYKYGNDRIHDITAKGDIPAIMYFDVDSMQSYNANYGFKKGDQLLILVANILSDVFEHGLVVRIVDDHFIVVDSYGDEKSIISKVEEVNRRLKTEAYGTTTGILTGIYIGEKIENVVEGIDRAIRANKLIGADLNKAYRFYSFEDDDIFKKQRYIVENFYRAMNEGWIKVFYQCFLRIETGNGMGFEALARWVDPEKGMISPGTFIPALEKYHLMQELDLYMFEQVCKEIKLRYEAKLPLLPVSINFSRQDFDYIDVIGEINRIYEEYDIEQYGIDRSYFMIEITEQDMATATDKFYEQLDAIRESGFKLWVDDFGSGYSSLNVFSSFNIDLIKFDMDLLRNLDVHNGANRVILKAMVDVAKKLGIHTLCEGLETEDQREFLKDIGCELAQGYLYHKPEGLDTIFRRLDIGLPIPDWETDVERIQRDHHWGV